MTQSLKGRSVLVTGGDVMLFSSGAGNAGFKGTLDNTKVFGLVKSAMGL